MTRLKHRRVLAAWGIPAICLSFLAVSYFAAATSSLNGADDKAAPVPAPDNAAAGTEASESDILVASQPEKVAGHTKCVDCHKSEVKSWLATKHATRAFDLLRTAPTAAEYAEKLGIRPADIATRSLCTKCHATPQRDGDHTKMIAGVSCESCHNPSGGNRGWLNMHAVYGSQKTRRIAETSQHYQQRQQNCRDAGQLRSNDLYQLARRCFECHIVDSESLAEVGHDHGDGFELVDKMLGEVRHNHFLNPNENAKVATLWTDSLHHGGGRTAKARKRVMFIVGQLVDLEMSFRNLAKATKENDFTDLMMERIEDAFGLLAEDLLEELSDTELPVLENVVKVVEVAFEALDDDGFDPENIKSYIETADVVRIAAIEFSKRDGSKLGEIDGLDLISE
ncbi:MAG: hypothetical protein ACI9G1_003495 [Pirellulaceae bacterium]